MKKFSHITFVILLFVISLALYIFFTNPWIFMGNYLQLIIAVMIFFAATTLLHFNSHYISLQKLFFPILLLYAALMVIFPVRNLSLGDGLLLLENVMLEGNIFGSQLTLDEIVEAQLHSRIFAFMGGDPRLSYQILSTIAGFFFLWLLAKFMKKNNMGVIELLVVISSGGMFLFHGYTENYTLTTLVIFIYIILVYQWIQDGKTDLHLLLPATALAVIAVLFHLVAGYLIFSLVWLAWYLSTPKKFIPNSFITATLAMSVIGIVFSYFLFFADPTADKTGTIAFHPPFYSFLMIFSLHHFRDILDVLLFNAMPAAGILFFIWIADYKSLITFTHKKENRFLVIVVTGFFLHACIHIPQLGFPADWDLMGFYWLPLTLLATLAIKNLSEENKSILIPFILFSLSFHFINMEKISQPDTTKEIQLTKMIHLNSLYLKKFSGTGNLPRDRKKFFVKTDFFLFRTIAIMGEEGNDSMVKEGNAFKKEFYQHFFSQELDKIWLGDFLSRLTQYHIRYLELTGNFKGNEK